VGHAPPEPGRMLKVLSHGASRSGAANPFAVIPSRFERGQVAPVRSRFAFREPESQGLRV